MNTHWLHWTDILGAAGGIAVLAFRSWLAGKALDIGEAIVSRVEKWLVKTEREAVEWTHHRNRAARQGHQPKKTADCQDGSCVKVVK